LTQTILVIDDEAGIRNALRDILEDERYRVLCAEDGVAGLELLETERADLVLLDVWLPRMGGMDVLVELKKRHPETEVVVVSGHGNIDMAVRSVKLGAFDFLEKPLSLDKVVTACRNALALGSLRTENKRLKSAIGEGEELVGASPAMLAVRQSIEQSAACDARVLITGENGTGKELVARAIHERSGRSGGPFVEVNCAAIPETLIESELFGHEKGAFTDASGRRKGRFEAADSGTLFMDEVADMSLPAQAKVLRAIQELRFERVGGEEQITVDLRIIAATNKDLEAEVAAGRFREDLFFRLNVIPIKMPALRERGDDIGLLARHFLELTSASGSRQPKRLSPAAVEALKAHPWPGNVRELRNLMERVYVMREEEVIGAEAITELLGQRRASAPQGVGESLASLKLMEARDQFEKNYLLQKLKENGYNITKTAEAIGVYPSSLHAKIKKFGIQAEK
jgi:two-component system, NtrC family, nitrogen regulation response regulator NtrX